VHDDDELMLISQQGKILRMVSSGIRAIGRATQGVRLIGMEEGDQVVSVAKLAEKEDEEGAANGEVKASADTSTVPETSADENDAPPDQEPPTEE
jgi:DNA gyrase subunit A